MLSEDQKKTNVNDTFSPALGLKNAHLQTILSSFGPRKIKLNKQIRFLREKQQRVTLDCGDGIRLEGKLNLAKQQQSKQLAILIHGWEGCHESGYIVSMASHFLKNGIDVFRLNLRDHGETHHLNEGIFNSTLVEEVIGAIENLQQRHTYESNNLIGFSLGGNFSLRVAALSEKRNINLDKVITFCPVIHAKKSNAVLNINKNWLYGKYFIRRWKRSLFKKLDAFPHYQYAQDLKTMKTLDEMNEKLIPVYTEFKNIDDYFDAYALNNKLLEPVICPCYLHFSEDDMIIPVEDVYSLKNNEKINITVTKYGGHCGFLSNWRFDSWQDERALELISS